MRSFPPRAPSSCFYSHPAHERKHGSDGDPASMPTAGASLGRRTSADPASGGRDSASIGAIRMAIANLVTQARLLAVAPFGYAMPGRLFLEIGAPIRAAEAL